MDTKIGIPTVSGMTGALKAGAVGAIGGALVSLSQKYLGKGWLGAVAGIAVAGSVLKGQAGETIATVLGFEMGKELMANGFSFKSGTQAASTSTDSAYTVV